MSFPLGLFLVFASGLISLAYEIVWYRAYSCATRGGAPAFGMMLGFYLLGIAFGSYFAKRYCDDTGVQGQRAQLKPLAGFLLVANLIGFLVVPIMAWTVTKVISIFALFSVLLAAGGLGAAFPLTAHYAVKADDNSGAKVSQLYLSNILGSTLGSLLVGFVALDHLSLGATCVVLLILGLLMVTGLLCFAEPKTLRWAAPTGLLLMALTALLGPRAYDGVYHKFVFRGEYRDHPPLKVVLESRHGVITVTHDDHVLGGGAYDGVFNTSLIDDRNVIIRPYTLGAFREAAGDVLVVGLATGSWAQVVAHLPGFRSMVAVEINPDYFELIERYPEVRSLLHNPTFTAVYDDGRRWLQRNPGRKFDTIVQNTTLHWRAHSTNLLSKEYLELVRAHLNPGGVLLFNATASDDALKTGCEVFPYAMRIHRALLVSDAPLQFHAARWEWLLRTMRIDGKPIVDLTCDPANPACQTTQARFQELLAFPNTQFSPTPPELGLETRASVLARTQGASVITDDNTVAEWRSLKF